MPALTTTDGRALAWREAGSGPPLLCHPGGPGFSSASFGDLGELAEERTLILLDPRGTGGSDRPADVTGYSLDDYVEDVEALREHLGLDRVDLLGHSHGGFVAIRWGATHPDQVGRLVLASTAPRFTDAIRQARMDRVASHRGRPYFDDAYEALRAHQDGRYADGDELAALYRRESRLFAPLDADDADIVGIGEILAGSGNNADALRYFNEHVAGGMDQRPLLARIDAPTLVVGGDLDPFAATWVEIADALPNPTVVVVDGADHFPFLERGHRAAWSRAVLDFLAPGGERPAGQASGRSG